MRPQKNLSSEHPMSSVEIAADYANRMIEREARGPGDTEDAMRRLEAKTGVGYWTLWGLRYRRRDLKTIAADQFQRIRNAYLATCERQLQALQHELAIEQARSGNDFQDLVAEAESLVAKLKAARTKQGLTTPPANHGAG
jgi:hypothetical protein